MANTTVVNKRIDPYDVYIGRPTKWGNPFHINDLRNREQAVRAYKGWIIKQPHLLAALGELRGKRLGCFCKPEACHGDILAKLADGEKI